MATFILYNPKNDHNEKCAFEMFNGREVTPCDKPAIGIRGVSARNGTPLCADHFRLGASLEGVPQYAIKDEKEK